MGCADAGAIAASPPFEGGEAARSADGVVCSKLTQPPRRFAPPLLQKEGIFTFDRHVVI
jgi:hypothetical protein